jgi:4-alpha-glucanotransferase
MNFQRSSGILLHPTSLPGPYGIGDMGPEAFRFLDFLATSKTKLWQVLPLGPTGYGDSPYQCFSAFAGNPYLISPDLLLHDDFIHANDIVESTKFPSLKVDYGKVIPWKLNLLEKSFNRFKTRSHRDSIEFEKFCADEDYWLNDFSIFMAIKENRGGGSWDGWPEPLRVREHAAIQNTRKELADSITRYKFYQYLFFRQWEALRSYAGERGIQIIGDIPIFVAYDSADAWANPDLFYLDGSGRPTVVAGVPPDGFSADGQLWGNPLYNWEKHKEEGFKWWLKRFRATLKQVDIIRLDHFRGFAGYYEIPAGERTARNGKWKPALGFDLFTTLKNEIGDLPIIAEDLGLITEDVVALRDGFGFPGMRILQFAFSGPDNPFLPSHYSQNCVVYTGVHDNDTSRSWFDTTSSAEREFARQYLDYHPDQDEAKNFPPRLIRSAWESVAMFAIAPMQDFLLLGGEARMNYPSRLGGNWDWRMEKSALTDELMLQIGHLNYLYSR